MMINTTLMNMNINSQQPISLTWHEAWEQGEQELALLCATVTKPATRICKAYNLTCLNLFTWSFKKQSLKQVLCDMFHVLVRRNHILEFPLVAPQDQDIYLLAFFLLLQIFILIQKQARTNY